MKFRFFAVLAVVGVVAFLSGCVSNQQYRAYQEEYNNLPYVVRAGNVLKDWALDFIDIPSVELSAGNGFGIYVQPTKFLSAGFLMEDVLKVGWRKRAAGFYREVRTEGGLSWLYYRDQRFYPYTGTADLFDMSIRPRLMKDFTIRHNETDRHWCDIGAEVSLLCVGASVFVSPKEGLDFVFSTVMLPFNLTLRPLLALGGIYPADLDIMEDDSPARYGRKHGIEVIKQYESFPPADFLNDLAYTPY